MTHNFYNFIESHASGTINLAIPSLAGFIDSWFPFGNGRFFDTPPSKFKVFIVDAVKKDF
jgi:hypothetical protein